MIFQLICYVRVDETMKCSVLGPLCFLSGLLSILYLCRKHQSSFLHIHLVDDVSIPPELLLLIGLLGLTVLIHHKRTNIAIETGVISSMLGAWFGFSVNFIFTNWQSSLLPLLAYISLMCWFHFMEFFLTAIFHPHTLSITSFLLNQSAQYIIAFFASVVEFLIELYVLGSWKATRPVFWLGFAICFGGDLIRKAAMIQAGVSFTHLVQYSRRANHKLVTDGVYSYVRHPTYTGWTLFAVFSQIMMLNPVCTVLFTYAAFVFFSERVEEEELLLISFFGSEYVKYKSKVPSGLPFIKGAQLMNN